MTTLEKRILQHGINWVWHDRAFTTVVKGHAFAVYREAGGMRFCGLTKKDTAFQLEVHKTEAPAVTASWAPYRGSYQDRMFDTAASKEFVARVILNALPELQL